MKRTTLFLLLLAAACAPALDVTPYQQATVVRCGFRPSPATVQRILAVGNEALRDPDTLALAICHQVRNLGTESSHVSTQFSTRLERVVPQCLRPAQGHVGGADCHD